MKVYLDTSVVSYLYQLDTPEKMKDTLELWELFRQGRYEVYISDIVLNEISGCSQEKLDILLGYLKQVQYHLVHTDEDTVELAEKFIDFAILKKKSFDDCQHIGTAVVNGCDCIISWNFKHIVNVKTIRGMRAITNLEGYKQIEILSPSALLESER